MKDLTQKSNDLQKQIYRIQEKYNSVEDEKQRKLLQSQERAKVYQKRYQDALKKQVGSILDKMHKEEFKTVQPYLNECYEKSFIGNMYVLHEEGIPLIIPIDQEKVVRAVQLDSKISGGLYRRLGEDVGLLKRRITAEVSRGIATGMSYDQMARQLASRTKIGYNNAVRITRTEGHRIQQQSTMDACYAARDRGADVVKQWDAALDAATISEKQAYFGEYEIAETYDYGNSESATELKEKGIEHLKELKSSDSVSASFSKLDVDIGDIVGGRNRATGIVLKEPVTQEIVKIKNGIETITYKVGEE